MGSTTALFFFAFLHLAPACEVDAYESERRALLAAINARRLTAGIRLLVPHPALCAVAHHQARQVAATGSADSDLAEMLAMARQLREAGYVAHQWNESTLMAGGTELSVESWQQVQPARYQDAVAGDFEDIGIGWALRDEHPVASIVLGLSRRTIERRRATPLGDLAWVRAEILEQSNEERRAHRLRPLKPDPRLDEAAQKHAESMLRQGYYDHRGRDGSTALQRARGAGYPHRPVAENLAKGLFTPREVVQRWMNSPGHRANILRRSVDYMGVGIAVGENDDGIEVLWVQVLAGAR